MADNLSVALDSGLNLREVITKGSVLQINLDYENANDNSEFEKPATRTVDFIGSPVESFEDLKSTMLDVDPDGLVKKKIIEEGGGLPLDKNNTVSVAYSGYWEKEPEPFDIRRPEKPLDVDLNDSGLLPGLHMAVESMLVGELSVFWLSYKVMYGELGVPPRIKKKADCVFYIKLIKSIITPAEGKLDPEELNAFQRTLHEVKLLYGSGVTLFKSKNISSAIQVFRKAVYMLHNCRLADEKEEMQQESMLKKLYINLAVCYNAMKQPLKACIACNELRRLNSLWNNAKALLQNAKALRMIGEFEPAMKKLQKAKKLCPDRKEINDEFELLLKLRNDCNKTKLLNRAGRSQDEVSDEFKKEVDNLIQKFKENEDLCKLILPGSLNSSETNYVKEVCERENVFFNKVNKDYALDKSQEIKPNQNDSEISPDREYYGDLFS